MDFINHEKQDMADALEVCVKHCAEDAEFVAQFNRLTGCRFPEGGEADVRRFVAFVGEYVLIPMSQHYLDHLKTQSEAHP